MIEKLTDNEKEVLRAALKEGDYDCFSYEIAIYNYCELDPTEARGVLSSLVQKGILSHKRIKEDGEIRNYYSVISDDDKKELMEILGD